MRSVFGEFGALSIARRIDALVLQIADDDGRTFAAKLLQIGAPMLTFGEFGSYRIYCHAPATPPHGGGCALRLTMYADSWRLLRDD